MVKKRKVYKAFNPWPKCKKTAFKKWKEKQSEYKCIDVRLEATPPKNDSVTGNVVRPKSTTKLAEQEERIDTDTPEHALLEAVLQRAVGDLRETSFTDQSDLRTARNWLTSKSKEPWSFLWICDHLELSNSFRKRLYMLAYSSSPGVH
jgi:hypothetical protein